MYAGKFLIRMNLTVKNERKKKRKNKLGHKIKYSALQQK